MDILLGIEAATSHAVGMTFRPALRPGALLLRRDVSHLQVGTSPGVVIADRPGLFPLLRTLDGTRDVARIETIVRATTPALAADLGAVLARLRSLGVVFDASRWSAPGRRGLDTEARHVDLAHTDPDVLRARPTFRLALLGDAVSAPLVDITRAVLVASGLTGLDAGDPELMVVVSCGEPSRSVFERPTMQGLDHLPVVIDEDRVRIGPLVSPGRTPCVSCHDLHRGDWDRAWSALVPQLGRHTRALTPPALSAVTTHAAALELAVEVLAHVDTGSARTLGRCLVVGPRHDARATWPVAFHHGCACDLLSAA